MLTASSSVEETCLMFGEETSRGWNFEKSEASPDETDCLGGGGGVELCVFASGVGGWVGGGELTFDLSANSTAHRNHSGATSTLHWCDQNPVEMIPQWMISHYRPSVSGLLVY